MDASSSSTQTILGGGSIPASPLLTTGSVLVSPLSGSSGDAIESHLKTEQITTLPRVCSLFAHACF